jgi:hypothetical protein
MEIRRRRALAGPLAAQELMFVPGIWGRIQTFDLTQSRQ